LKDSLVAKRDYAGYRDNSNSAYTNEVIKWLENTVEQKERLEVKSRKVLKVKSP